MSGTYPTGAPQDGRHGAALLLAWPRRFRKRLRQCQYLEVEQNALRLSVLALMFLYCVAYAWISGEDVSGYLALLLLYGAFTLCIYVWLYRSPDPSHPRALTTTLGDRAVTTGIMALDGPLFAFAFWLFPWTDIGNTARHGPRYLLPSMGLSVIGFTVVVYANDYWRSPNMLPFAAGVWLCILASPLYAGVLIRRLNEANNKLKELATNDPLTRLPNRPLLYERLNELIAAAERHQRHFAVIFVDLDDFKHINDTGGHAAGDDALRDAASVLRQSIRQNDTVARLAGDEFVVLLHDVHHRSPATIRAIAENLRESLRANTKEHVCASLGIAVFPTCGRDAESLIRHADQAMYAAKAAGKRRCHLCDDLWNAALARKP